MGAADNPWRREEDGHLGTINPQGIDSPETELLDQGKVTEEEVDYFTEVGDNQILHTDGEIAYVLADKTEAGLLSAVPKGEKTAPGAMVVWNEVMNHSTLPPAEVELECNLPLATGDNIEFNRDDRGGVQVTEIYRQEQDRDEDPAMIVTQRYGVPDSLGSEEELEAARRQVAGEFAGSLGMEKQDFNIISDAEAEFDLSEGEKEVRKEVGELVHSTDEFDIRPVHYHLENGEGAGSSSTFYLVQVDEEVAKDVLEPLEGEKVRKLEGYLEDRVLDGLEDETVEDLIGYIETPEKGRKENSDSYSPTGAIVRAQMAPYRAFMTGVEASTKTAGAWVNLLTPSSTAYKNSTQEV